MAARVWGRVSGETAFPFLPMSTPCCGQRLGRLQSWAGTGRMEGQRDGEQIPGQERNGEQLLEEVIGTQFTYIILQFLVQTFQIYKYTKADNIIQSRCVPHPPGLHHE